MVVGILIFCGLSASPVAVNHEPLISYIISCIFHHFGLGWSLRCS